MSQYPIPYDFSHSFLVLVMKCLMTAAFDWLGEWRISINKKLCSNGWKLNKNYVRKMPGLAPLGINQTQRFVRHDLVMQVTTLHQGTLSCGHCNLSQAFRDKITPCYIWVAVPSLSILHQVEENIAQQVVRAILNMNSFTACC